MILPSGACPQNVFFGADSRHRPGAGARGMRPNMFVPWPKLASGLAAVRSRAWRGLRWPGARGAGGRLGLGTETLCTAVAATGAGGDSPLTSTMIFITQLRYRADMKCGAGRGGNKYSAGVGGSSIPRET